MKLIDFFRSKIILFIIQILILSLFLFYSGYHFSITFDSTVFCFTKENYPVHSKLCLFDSLPGLFFIYFIWFITSLIPIFFYNNLKKAYSMNLMTFFFPNFFVFAFLYNNSRNYFDSNFYHHFLHALLLGILIITASIVFSLILKTIMKVKTEEQIENLNIIINEIKSKCPKCGTEFNSTPIFCYNCESKIILRAEENVGIK